MNLRMGNQVFSNVAIPVLWGTRAIVQDEKRHLHVLDLSTPTPTLEIVSDQPAAGIEYQPIIGGFRVFRDGTEVYTYLSDEKVLRSDNLGLPECQIAPSHIRVGTNVFSGNVIANMPVGITITREGIGIGGAMPKGLAALLP